jgi:hypothetical protein
MKTSIVISTVAVMALSAPAFAGNHTNAQAMVENIKTFGGNTAAAIRPGSDLAVELEIGKGDFGWGNAGSRATGSVGFAVNNTVGGQVAKNGRN